jgi:hypothetical protein
MKVCGFTFSEVEIDSLKTVFENVNDNVRFIFVQSVLKSRVPEINNHAHRNDLKSDSQAERCFEASKQLAKENKHRCALKKLNEALAHAKAPEFVEMIVKHREILIQKLIPLERKGVGLNLLQENSSPVDHLYRGANEEYEAFSMAAKVEFSEEIGRHVVAMEDLEPGQFFIKINCHEIHATRIYTLKLITTLSLIMYYWSQAASLVWSSPWRVFSIRLARTAIAQNVLLRVTAWYLASIVHRWILIYLHVPIHPFSVMGQYY